MNIGKPVKIKVSDLTDEMALYIYDSTNVFLYECAVRELYETVNRLVWL